MARRAGLGLLPFVVLAVLCSGLALIARQSLVAAASTTSAACVGDLNRTTYASGFASSDFTNITAAAIVSGGLQLNTGLTPLNPEKIVLPFDQTVRIKSVYNNAGAAHTLGWFYLDDITPTYYNASTGTLVDANANGVPDLYEALWTKSGTTPKLLTQSLSYSDGGNYPHIPNLLEPYDPINNPSGIGHMIFKLMNDNAATGYTTTWNSVNLPPVADASTAIDGIFDYDVNGDGTVGNEADRTVDLGIIQGGKEVVFYMMVWYGQTGRNASFGMTGATTTSSSIVVHFSKTVLNTDVGQTVACGGTSYPSYADNDARLQTLVYGWLSSTAIARLATATYGNLVLPHEVHRVVAGASGTVPHYFVGAPSNDQNRWIIGFEDLLGYTSTSCSGCTHSDFSLEDVVLLIERANGGQVISQNVASDIPTAALPNTIISRIRVRYSVTLPSPACDGDASAGVQLYYSVDNGTTWRALPMTNPLTGDVVVDVLANGDIGNTLLWKATFSTSVQACQPILNHVDIGYEGVQHGEYKFSAPMPLANMVYTGTLETPSASWTTTRNDFSLRGHFYGTKLFDPTTLVDFTGAASWDSGALLSAANPTSRYLFTNNNGAALALTTANGGATVPVAGTSATLFQDILPASVRALLSSGALVYDFNGDAVVNDTDAQFVLEWTRGWEYPAGITFYPTATTGVRRAWRLGPIHSSSPALVGPPGVPGWEVANSSALSTYIPKYTAFRTSNKERKTLAIVGSQDGMLHAFNAGQFRQNPDPDCLVQLSRGCFASNSSGPDYGDGAEVWAYVPPRLLSSLKNNHPKTRSYLPASNPPAEVDGSVTAEDILYNGDFTTAIFASLGRNQPFITALQYDNDPTQPLPLWTDDWTDTDYNGSNFSPGVVPFAQTPSGPKPMVIVSSGLAASVKKSYLYLIDATTGRLITNAAGTTTIGKVALDSVGTTLGIGGYPNIVDADQDGVFDRAYVVDTGGSVYKVDFATSTVKSCKIGSVGESVFAGMAVAAVGDGSSPRIRLFIGGGPNPDGTTNPAIKLPYHLFAIQDNDAPGTCTASGATSVYTYTLTSPWKLWAAPYVIGGTGSGSVYFATAQGGSASVCDNGGGQLIPLGFDAASGGAAVLTGPIANLGGEAVSSIRVYDGHALINTVGGVTNIVGSANGWNNVTSSTAVGGKLRLATATWSEY
jgi:type IV pilus assembly protein PilY1